MKLFRSYTFTFFQVAIFKLSLLLLGIAIGANWPYIFAPYTAILVVAGFLAGIYIMFVSFRDE